MTITLTQEQERALQEAIRSGVVQSVEDFVESAIEALPRRRNGVSARSEAVRQMQEFGEKRHLNLGEPITRKILHEGHRF